MQMVLFPTAIALEAEFLLDLFAATNKTGMRVFTLSTRALYKLMEVEARLSPLFKAAQILCLHFYCHIGTLYSLRQSWMTMAAKENEEE